MRSTSIGLHIFGMNILEVMVQDSPECLEQPGVNFSGPEPFEETLEASVLNYRQHFNTADYKRGGLNWALTVFLLSEAVQGEEQ